MKKLMLLAVLTLSATAVLAQPKAGTITVMPKVGINIASLTDYKGSDPRVGVVFGADAAYQYTSDIAFSVGFNYSMQGGKYEGGGYEETVKLDYINIPLLFNYYVLKNFAVKIGLQPAFSVNGKSEEEREGKSVEYDLDKKAMELSIPIGVSYEYENFVIDARYNWGLTKAVDGADCKNSVFQITLGYKLPI